MTNDDVLYAYRLRVLASARELGSVAAACRLHGIHRSTFYRWKAQVDRFGLEILRPRERRRPQMPNAIPVLVEQRIVAFALGHPGYGPAHIASRARPGEVRRLPVSANGVYRVLRRHGIGTRALRNGLLAGYAAPPEPARDPEPERHIEVDHPGELVQMDCFCIGRLAGTKGVVWQYTAIDAASRLHLGRAARHAAQPRRALRSSRLAHRVARELRDAGWELERVTTDNGSEFRNHVFDAASSQRLGARPHADQPRPAAVERLRRARAAHHPRGVLEARLRALPGAQVHGPAARAGALPRALQLRPHAQRAPDQRPDAR